MSGLFLIRDGTSDADAALARVEAAYARGGLDQPRSIALAGWSVRHWHYAHGGPDTLYSAGDEFAAIAGTITVDGRMGRPALERLIAIMASGAPDWSRIAGQFVALVRSAGRTWLFTDFFAAFQMFRNDGNRLFSTSLLGAAEAMPRLRFDPQAVYEFAFNVVPIGDDTIFRELRLLGPGSVIELTADETIAHPIAKALPRAPAARPFSEALSDHHLLLSKTARDHVGMFGDAIHCPLSGGLDSRLLLAALREAGARPHVYVYGAPDDEDVVIARAIAAAEGFALEVVDKDAGTVEPDRFAEEVDANYHAYDALPTFGNIFDTDVNRVARERRHPADGLAASGGCGEVYRDFFYMADRGWSADAVARTFFARFTRGDATDAFDGRAFIARIAAKLSAAVGSEDGRLTRTEVEQLYPRVRCRSLFGREISLEARLGAYFMPFLDHRIAAEALTLPMRWKRAGRFEAALLARFDPTLAAYPSAYGHDFGGAPSLRHRFSEWTTRMRPVRLRQASYAIQRWRGPVGDEHGGLLTPDYMGRVIDLDFPAMRRFFHVDAITDSSVWRRVAALEYLAKRLGSKLN